MAYIRCIPTVGGGAELKLAKVNYGESTTSSSVTYTIPSAGEYDILTFAIEGSSTERQLGIVIKVNNVDVTSELNEIQDKEGFDSGMFCSTYSGKLNLNTSDVVTVTATTASSVARLTTVLMVG